MPPDVRQVRPVRPSLPAGWTWKTIPELTGDDGVFVDGDWVESVDQDPDGDVRLIQLADVGDGYYRDKSARFLTRTKAAELGCTYLKTGDVLIARMPDPLGRACIFPGDAKPAVTVVDVCIARSGKPAFDHRWLSCFVNAQPFRSAVAGLQAGSTRKRISRKNLGTIRLPVPPLAEQRRIVGEIEKQFTRLEAGVAALRRVQANLHRYRAAVLKAACEGRLVSTKGKWAKHKIGDILTLVNGRAFKPSDWKESGIPIVRIQNLNNPDAPFNYYDRELPEKFLLRDGDLLFAWSGTPGTSFGAHIWRGGKAWLNQHIFKVLFDEKQFNRGFLRIAINSNLNDYIRAAHGGAGLAHITKGKFEAHELSVPPVAEQERIVAEEERRLSVVAELSALVTANLQRATRLRQSILQQAFDGRLVRQNQGGAA